MAKLNHKNLGSVQKTAYLTATITTVDSENDTACFNGIGKCPSGSAIPLFYHCSHDAVQRDNGALEGAAGAFNEDDEVIVQCEIVNSTEYKPLYVIGFVDKPKQCAIQFKLKLTRSDGVLITDAGLLDYFLVFNSSEVSLTIDSFTYNAGTGYWKIVINSDGEDPAGYWIDYKCSCGFATQYPGKIVATDKRQVEDLIQPSKYEDTIPLSCFHFRVTRDEDGSLVDNSLLFAIKWENTLGASDWMDTRAGHGLFYDSDPESSTYQHFWFEAPEADPAGYWITFMKVTNSIQSQYPKKVRGVEQKQPEDLLQPGVYNATVPVWITMGSNTAPDYELIEDCWLSCEELHSMAEHVKQYIFEQCLRYYTTNKQVTETIDVISSVPYMVSVYGSWNGQIQGFGSVENAYYSIPNCPNIIPDRECFSWEVDSISLSGSGGMSVSWAKGESMPVSDTKQFIASGGGSYSASVLVTVSDYEYQDECIEGETTHERTVTVPWERLKTSDEEMRARVSVSAFWDY